jgi:hypothetical protein
MKLENNMISDIRIQLLRDKGKATAVTNRYMMSRTFGRRTCVNRGNVNRFVKTVY